MGGRAGGGARGGGGISLPSTFHIPDQGGQSRVTVGNTTITAFNGRNISEGWYGAAGGQISVFVNRPSGNTVKNFDYKAGRDNEVTAMQAARKWITSGAKGGQPAKA